MDIIVRIPRWLKDHEPDAEILDQAANFHFVRQQGIRAPKVLAFDATSANKISSPYTVQELVHGTALDLIYDQLSLEEELDITSEFIKLLAKLELIEFTEPGRVVCGPAMSSVTR